MPNRYRYVRYESRISTADTLYILIYATARTKHLKAIVGFSDMQAGLLIVILGNAMLVIPQ